MTSSRMAKLGWPEEVFYRRLMSVVDDFGRYYADAGLLRAACYPRQLNKVSDPDIGKWLRVCVDAALVRVYPAEDGESYLELIDFRQQARAKTSKFPEARTTCAADATQVHSSGEANAPVFVFGDVSEGGGGGGKARKRATLTAPDGVSTEVWSDWLSLRKAKRAPVTATVVQTAEDEARKAGLTLEAFLRVWCARGSQGLEAAWLKPAERGSAEPQWAAEKRDRMAQFAGPAAAKPKTDLEVIDGAACIVDRRLVR